MKIGAIVRVKFGHHSKSGMIGTVIEDFAILNHNRGKAFRIMFADGTIRTKMAKHLEKICE
jgi:hypothetical protein